MSGRNRTIPEIRERLCEIANQLKAIAIDLEARTLCDEVIDLALETKRRSPVRKAARRSLVCTDEVLETIRIFARHNPGMTYMQIAGRFNVSIGRVSEALAGKRGEAA